MRSFKLLYVLIVVFMVSCSSDDDSSKEICGNPVIINENLFLQESPSDFMIQNAQISNDCIVITIVSNGCDMATWQADLLNDGIQTASIPPKRLLRLKFVNLEDCEAAYIKTYMFYLGSENETVIYSLQGWDGELVHNP
jgi:hypothetical protein